MFCKNQVYPEFTRNFYKSGKKQKRKTNKSEVEAIDEIEQVNL